MALLASQTDQISLNPLGIVALSGLGFHRAYFKPLFDNLGIRFVNLAPWDTKSAYNNLTDASMPPAEEAMMRRFYGDVQEQLDIALASGRGDKLSGGAAGAMDAGPYLIASDAVKAGLVDDLSYAQEFEARLRRTYPGASLVSGLGTEPSESWGGPVFTRRVAIVWLSGDIVDGKGTAGEEIGTDAVSALERLRNDPSVAAILLKVDSPGGTVVTSDLIAREVRLAVQSGKPVAVSMGQYAASGGYYISAPASHIVAEPLTVTGSIGVTGLVPNLSESLHKLGINYDGFDLSPGASFLDPAKPVDPSELAKDNAAILSYYARFVEVVAAGRKMPEDAVRNIAEGRIWTGREASHIGLVDELGGLDEAKAWLKTKIGDRLSYFNVLPGESSPFASLGRLSADLRTALGQGEGKDVETLLEPFAKRLNTLFDMGAGPLYYLGEDVAPF